MSEANHRMFYLPAGIGHGFATLADDTHVIYLMNRLYDAEYARSVAWDDGALRISWPVSNPILSERDRRAPKLERCGLKF